MGLKIVGTGTCLSWCSISSSFQNSLKTSGHRGYEFQEFRCWNLVPFLPDTGFQLLHSSHPNSFFTTIGEKELNKLIYASKPTTCLLDPVPTKLLKELSPVAELPLLNIINSSLSLGHVQNSSSWRLLSLLLRNLN